MTYTFHDKLPCLEDAAEEAARQCVELDVDPKETGRVGITFTHDGWFVETVRHADGERRFKHLRY